MGLLLGSACEAPLPARDQGIDSNGASSADAGGELRVHFDPDAPTDAVSPVTRITVVSPEPLLDPQVILVSGVLSVAQLRDLGRSTVPQTLTSRALAALVWLEADPTVLVVAPLAALAPGSYTLALSAPLASFPFTVTADAMPALGRIWPDRMESSPSAQAAVWCGPTDLGSIDLRTTLEPALLPGRFVSGTGGSIAAPHCVSWFSASASIASDAASSSPPAVPPPWVVFDDGSSAALEPILFFERDLAPASPATCSSVEIPFGPGCADVQDDRIVVRPPDARILWTTDAGQGAVVRSSGGGNRFTLRPLPPDGVAHVDALDPSGQIFEADVAIQPGETRPHVVLNEVMANPAGAEPSEEWVELYNDGSSDVALGGFVLVDGGGRTALPEASLAPGAFALVVPDSFVADDGIDPPPDPGALLLRVPALGRAGLSNEGEVLTLLSPEGRVISTFPAVKTKNGVSTARVAPDAPDTDPDAFAPSANGSATPGAPNDAR